MIASGYFIPGRLARTVPSEGGLRHEVRRPDAPPTAARRFFVKQGMIRRACMAAIGLGALAIPATATTGSAPGPVETTASTAPAPATTGPAYDRNPSVVQDDNTTWMFFARSEEVPCNRLDGCNADNTTYDLYYQQSTDGGATWAAPVKLADNDDVPLLVSPVFYGRTVAATKTADGTISVFWASGGNSSTLVHLEKPPSSATWTTTYLTDEHYFNVEAVAKGNTVYAYVELCCTQEGGVYVRTLENGTFSALTPVALGMSIPKAIVDAAGVVRLTMVETATGDFSDYVASSADGIAFSSPTIAAPNAEPGAAGNWDPTLVQTVDGVYHLYYAPGPFSGENQRIEKVTSTDFVTWSAPTPVTAPANYWDYWPEAASINGDLRLFYTSEAATSPGDAIGTGHIWTINSEVVPS
ncbi:MAG: hypothetical protein ACRDJP_10245, partial [Actinomycetota bacterium]